MSNFEFSIRAFKAADKPAVHRVRIAAFAPVFASFRELVGPEIAPLLFAKAEEAQGAWLDKICGEASGHSVHVAVSSGEVVGFCGHSCDAETLIGEIGLNGVHPDFAGGGIGAALYEHVLELMRSAGMKVAVVSTGGDASHAPARAAYRKTGFDRAIPSVQLSRTL